MNILRQLKQTIFFTAITVVMFFVLAPTITIAADPRTCADPKDKWYECYQLLSDVNKYVNTWCSNADTKKRTECQITLLGSVDYTPPYLKSNKPECAKPETATKIKNQCWVVIKSDSDWYAALILYGEECTFTEVAKDCKIINDFLDENGWARDEDATTGLNGNIDQTRPEETPFIKRISAYLRWLIVGIGVLAVFSIVIAGIQYSAAQDNPQSVAAAKTRISNVVIGILIYFTMFAMLQWLVPGGVF